MPRPINELSSSTACVAPPVGFVRRNARANLATGTISDTPTAAPSCVAVSFSSGVAPASSARIRASPAPAPIPRPPATARPGRPKGAAARNGRIDPPASPNLRKPESSYPGAASNGDFSVSAVEEIPRRIDSSYSSGASAEAPTAAVSSSPIAPDGTPLASSHNCPMPDVCGAGVAATGGAWRNCAAASIACWARSSCCCLITALITCCSVALSGPVTS